MSIRAARQKLQIFKNPRWRTAAILKIVKSPYLSEKLCDFDETWYTTSDIEPDDSHVTKKFLTFKMAAATTLKVAATTLKIAFLAIIHRPIVRFQRNFV